MSDNQTPEQPNCMDRETEADILPPEAHDLIEVDQELLWEINVSAAYRVTSECSRDGCQGQYRSVNIVGQKITTVQDFKMIAYQIYESYYDNPRNIPYPVLQFLIDIPDSDNSTREGIATDLSNVAQLGCDDADMSRHKRTKQEVFDAVLPDGL